MKNRNFKENNKEKKIEITKTMKVLRSEELLSFLLSKLNTSRNNVKMLLSNHQVLVNGSVVTQFNLMLVHDDEVKIAKHPVAVKTEAKPKMKRIKPIEIIYEDDEFLAINKPNGLLSVESDKERENAYNYALMYLQSIDKRLRPFILHRIDKETSGVLVFAKNEYIHSKLKMNWNDLVKVREYYAVVEGKLPKKHDILKMYLKENENNLVYETQDRTGHLAITEYEVLKESNDYSLVRCLIQTGRKNQIRVAFKTLGHPIVGDDKYGFNKNPLNRLGLHASKLEFVHPDTNELMKFEAKCPNTFFSLFNKK